ncbi:DUF4224 domain-containing protein [Enterobacter kobei]|uniref:DUF4224 domain-containing protein n=1 Tax=Enterobacter kobei TaxID=208224 RepID=UPI0030765C63
MKVSPRERFATVVLFGLAQLDGELYSQVCDYLDNQENTSQYDEEEDDRLNRYIINAMEAHPPVHNMHQEGLNNLLQAIYVKFENQLPGGAALYSFIKKWTDNPGKREEMLPQTSTSTSTSTSTEDNTHAQVAPLRGYKHTYATLDQEIALALLPIEPAATVSVSALRQAESLIEEDREDFKRWSMALRTTEQILKYSRNTIFGVIQNVPAKDTHHFPDSLRRYIDNWLAENGVFEQDPNDTEATSKSLAAGRGEYVEGVSDPADPKWVKTETKTIPQNASNEVEKTEVVTDSQAEAARETLNKMGYSVYASEEQISDMGIFIRQGKTGVKQIKAWTPRLRAAVSLARALPLKPGIRSMFLIHQPSGSKYTRDGFNSRWREAKLAAQAKYPHLSIDFTFHDLKAKGISDLEGISDADIEKLTGYKIPSKQCESLRDAGIFFITRRDGRPRTTWAHFNNPLSHRQKAIDANSPQPNFGALD